MEDYFALLSPEDRAILAAIAEHAARLGYKARKDKTKSLGYTFTHPKVKKLILRFCLSQGRPVLKLKFFASPAYSPFFQEAIRRTIEEYDYRYTGCYGCDNCDGTQGYTYRYPDGREYYRCGSELIEITDLRNLPLEETLALFTAQHHYYLGQA